MDSPVFFISVFVVFLYSVILHEIAHGYAALKCGDHTAFILGRLSLNPIRHIDPFFTILLPLILFFSAGIIFGGAKPVPVNPRLYRHPVRDDIIVALAGVAVNLFLAIFFAMLAHLIIYLSHKNGVDLQGSLALKVALTCMYLNLLLFIFNLIPIPPLDGSHVFKYLLPYELRKAYSRIGFFGIIILFFFINTPLFHKIMTVGRDFFMKITFLM